MILLLYLFLNYSSAKKKGQVRPFNVERLPLEIVFHDVGRLGIGNLEEILSYENASRKDHR